MVCLVRPLNTTAFSIILTCPVRLFSAFNLIVRAIFNLHRNSQRSLFVRYGTRIDEVRGFVTSGWSACDNNEGDISPLGELFRVSWDDFERDVLPKLGSDDTVILVNVDQLCEAPQVMLGRCLA